MSKTLITGATGLVGYNTAKALLADGREVRAAVRSIERARKILPRALELVEADICNRGSILEAMRDCNTVFHCAGLPEQWLRDPGRFQTVNVGGTRNVVESALELGVERLVYTSTIDVFAANNGAEYDETKLDSRPKGTAYERSKQDADRVVMGAVDRGLPGVFVHPAAVFGPGPSGSPGLNGFFADLRDRKMPGLLPGGMPIVYGPDLGRGHLLAELAVPGSRFIFCDAYFSLKELAELLASVCPEAKVPRMLPLWVARGISLGGEAVAGILNKAPLIPKGQLHFLLWQAKPQSGKAERELGWVKTPTVTAITDTIRFLAS